MVAVLNDVQIETERLTLRPHVLADREAMAAMHGDGDVMRFIGGAAMDEGDSWSNMLRNAGHWALMGWGLFSVIERADDTLVGVCGHATFHRGLGDEFARWPEGAWVFAACAHGRGIASEAMRAAQAWFDETYRPERTVCIIAPENAPSLRLAERLGYQRTGEGVFKGKATVMLAREVAARDGGSGG